MKNLYLLLSFSLLTTPFLGAMNSNIIERKRHVAEQVEANDSASSLVPQNQAQNWNSASFAAFYKEIDQLPKAIQELVRHYLIGESLLDYKNFISLLLCLHTKARFVTEPQNVSNLSGDALLKVYQEQFSLVSNILAIATEDSKNDEDVIYSRLDMITGFGFEMPRDGIEKFAELFVKLTRIRLNI